MRFMTHAVAEPDAEHIGVDQEVMLGQLDRGAAVDGEAAALAPTDLDTAVHLLGPQHAGHRHVVGAVRECPAD